jgi:hypothetical protein
VGASRRGVGEHLGMRGSISERRGRASGDARARLGEAWASPGGGAGAFRRGVGEHLGMRGRASGDAREHLGEAWASPEGRAGESREVLGSVSEMLGRVPGDARERLRGLSHEGREGVLAGVSGERCGMTTWTSEALAHGWIGASRVRSIVQSATHDRVVSCATPRYKVSPRWNHLWTPPNRRSGSPSG